MKDEIDKEMIPEVREIYESLKQRALVKRRKSNDEVVSERDYVRENGRKLTVEIYLWKTPSGIEEQLEYYDYRYFHRKTLQSE